MGLNFKRGFSMLEVMVVLAILIIFATLALSHYQRFKSQARQSSVQAELSGIFAAQKSFFAEKGTYHWHLPATGYVPEGIDSSTDNYPPFAAATRYYATYGGVDNGAVLTLSALSVTLPNHLNYRDNYGYLAAAAKCRLAGGSSSIDLVDAAVPGQIADIQPTTFRINAIGCPANNLEAKLIKKLDKWQINESRKITNLNAGL